MISEKTHATDSVNIEKAEAASAKYARAAARLNVIEALINERVNKIRNEYYEEIIQLNEEKESQHKILEAYAKDQKYNWGRRKSFELFHSVIGFRTGTPRVIKDRNFDWEDIIDIVKEKFPSFVRTRTELDKEAIIALRDDDVFLKLKKACYVDVVQTETFYVEAKSEELARA